MPLMAGTSAPPCTTIAATTTSCGSGKPPPNALRTPLHGSHPKSPYPPHPLLKLHCRCLRPHSSPTFARPPLRHFCLPATANSPPSVNSPTSLPTSPVAPPNPLLHESPLPGFPPFAPHAIPPPTLVAPQLVTPTAPAAQLLRVTLFSVVPLELPPAPPPLPRMGPTANVLVPRVDLPPSGSPAPVITYAACTSSAGHR
jgi:hypothetical protein